MEASAPPVDPDLEKAYIQSKKKEYEYVTALMDVNIRAFNAQQVASDVVLVLVCLVVVAGIGFAGFQLWKSVSIAGVQASNELELSASKVRVTSSVVGVVVLTISLAILYIYTTEIYRISIIGSTLTQGDQKSSK
jgi:TRAP-type C4-dicarboxylate transport system permease small subunit